MGKTNSIVKLTGATDDLELVVDTSSTDYISISNQTIINGSDTNFDIAGIKDSTPLANGATVILQKRSTKAKLLTLHIHVLTPTTINTNVFYAFDDRDVVKASRFTNPPTPNAIKSEIDATYEDQACITFTINAGNPFTISQCYGGFAAEGACYKNRASGVGSFTSAEVVIKAADQAGFNTTKTLNIIVVKDVREDVAGGGYAAPLGLTNFGAPYPFINASAPIATFAHETGHSLTLSTKIDPATNQHHDIGKGPDGKFGLMHPKGGSRWIRQEDWRKANNYARGTVYH